MNTKTDFEAVEVTESKALWAWLDARHAQEESVWLVTWKAAHRAKYVSREDVLDALIAYGWIDGRRMKVDDDRTKQLISPRKEQAWAQSYKTRAERLEAEGKMQPSGRAAIAESKRAGKWMASAEIDALVEPEDLVAALKSGGAQAFWQGSAPSYRRNILRFIAGAKRPETRAKRIATTVYYAARGQKVPQY